MKRQRAKEERQRWGYRFLKRHQLEWMTAKATLERQAGMSLADRAVAIRKEFKGIHINRTMLRKVYAKSGIKKKKFSWYKVDKTKDAATIA